MKKTTQLTAMAVAAITFVQSSWGETEPLKALLITGGCCHDYNTQKDILKAGIESRANIVVDQVHTDNSTTKPDLPIYGVPEYAEGYDIVIHDECAPEISDTEVVNGVLAPHRAGMPAANLHCAVHSYRVGDFKKPIKELGTAESQWFEFLGLQSSGHGPKRPISIGFVDKVHPITVSLEDWTTSNEELYNNLRVLETAHTLAIGEQLKKDAVVVWTNDYDGTRIFNTSLGHNNATVGDARYLDLVTRGILWACGKLNEKGEVAEGYEVEIAAVEELEEELEEEEEQ